MDNPAFVICALLLFAFSVYIGFLIGNHVGVRAVTKSDYWKLNIAAILICIVLSFFLSAVPLFYSVDVGLLAGAIVGLKMAFGESVGPWAVHDKMFNVNRAHRETAESGVGEDRRRRRAEKADAPDLISVEKTSAKGSKKSSQAKNER
jgi:hypothetical protein